MSKSRVRIHWHSFLLRGRPLRLGAPGGPPKPWSGQGLELDVSAGLDTSLVL